MISRLDELVAAAHREQLIREAATRRRVEASRGAGVGPVRSTPPRRRSLAGILAPVALRCLAVTTVGPPMSRGAVSGRRRMRSAH